MAGTYKNLSNVVLGDMPTFNMQHGYTEAVVSYGSQSGTLRAGDLGGRTTGLLPAGWSVVAIGLGGHGQADGPSLLLQKGKQRVKVKL